MTKGEFHESPMTRRSFLAGVAGTAGALAVGRALAARPAEGAYAMVAEGHRHRFLGNIPLGGSQDPHPAASALGGPGAARVSSGRPTMSDIEARTLGTAYLLEGIAVHYQGNCRRIPQALRIRFSLRLNSSL